MLKILALALSVLTGWTWANPTATPTPPAQSLLGDALTSLGSLLDCCPQDLEVLPRWGVPKRWRWDNGASEWVIDSPKGINLGAGLTPVGGEVILFVEVNGYEFGEALEDQSAFVANSLKTLLHECMHFKCPPHAVGGSEGGGEANPENPPTGEGQDPDCNNLNYATQAAASLCALTALVLSSEGPVPTGDGGVVPGTDTCEQRRALCFSLCRAHKEIMDRWNNPTNLAIAEACAMTGWDPEDEEGGGDDFSDCPDFPPPAIGIETPPFLDGLVVQPCYCECACDE